MNVKELRERLAQFPDDMVVSSYYEDNEWMTCSAVEIAEVEIVPTIEWSSTGAVQTGDKTLCLFGRQDYGSYREYHMGQVQFFASPSTGGAA